MPASQGRAARSRTSLVLLTLLLAATGCGRGTGAGRPEPDRSEAGTADSGSPQPASGSEPACGQPLRLPAAGPLTLAGRFPARAAVGAATVAGTVEATSTAAVGGVVRPDADLYLVRDGRVVAVPLPQDAVGTRWDLPAGATRRLPAVAGLRSCATGEPVPAGSYQLYTRVTVVPDQGAAVESFGGPWPLEVG